MRDSHLGMAACVVALAWAMSGPPTAPVKANPAPLPSPAPTFDEWSCVVGFRHGHAAIFLHPHDRRVEARIRWDGREYSNTYDLRFLAGWEVVSWKAVPLESRRVLLAVRCRRQFQKPVADKRTLTGSDADLPAEGFETTCTNGDEDSIWAVSLYLAAPQKRPLSVPDHHLVLRGTAREAGDIPSLLIDGHGGATIIVGHLSQGEIPEGGKLGETPKPRFNGHVYFNLCPWPIGVGGYDGPFSTPLAEQSSSDGD